MSLASVEQGDFASARDEKRWAFTIMKARPEWSDVTSRSALVVDRL